MAHGEVALCAAVGSPAMRTEGSEFPRSREFAPRCVMARVESPDEKAFFVGNSMRAGEGSDARPPTTGLARSRQRASKTRCWGRRSRGLCVRAVRVRGRWGGGCGMPRPVPRCGWSSGWFPARSVLRQLVPRAVGARRSEGGRSSERPTERDVGERGAVGPGSAGSSDFSSSSRRKRKMKKLQGDRGTIARGDVRSKQRARSSDGPECRNRRMERRDARSENLATDGGRATCSAWSAGLALCGGSLLADARWSRRLSEKPSLGVCGNQRRIPLRSHAGRLPARQLPPMSCLLTGHYSKSFGMSRAPWTTRMISTPSASGR